MSESLILSNTLTFDYNGNRYKKSGTKDYTSNCEVFLKDIRVIVLDDVNFLVLFFKGDTFLTSSHYSTTKDALLDFTNAVIDNGGVVSSSIESLKMKMIEKMLF